MKIKTENKDWKLIETGQEFVVQGGQFHEAVVGDKGWEYVAAWDEGQAKNHN